MARTLKLREVLKALLQQHAMSARQLSRETGVPPATIASYLAGRGQLRPEQVALVADRFGVSLDYLLFGQDVRATTLENISTQELFSGWLKVRIERAVPDRSQADGELESPPARERKRTR